MTLHIGNGILVDVKNTTQSFWDVVYASITAPQVVECRVYVDDDLLDIVYAGAGGSHSWWTNGGGKLFPPDRYPQGLPPGSTLRVEVSAEAAFRIDWYDGPK